MRREPLSGLADRGALVCAIAVGALLRFAYLPNRGLIYWDEAKFGLEGQRMLAGLQSLSGEPVSMLTGKSVGTAKPGHALLVGVSYAIFGVHDYAPLLMNATFSLGAIVLIYLIGARLFGPLVGALSALLLAASEYDVIYARSALSESDANTLFLAAVLCWLVSERRNQRVAAIDRQLAPGCWRYRAAAALLLGSAFTVNYRLIVYAAILIVLDLVPRVMSSQWRDVLRTGMVWAAGAATPVLLWQGIDVASHTAGVNLFGDELRGGWLPYARQILYQLHQGKQSVIRVSFVPYLQWFVVRQGWPYAVATALSVLLAAHRRTFAWVTAAALVLAPYGVFTFAPFYVPRNLSPSVPFTALLIAAGVGWAAERSRRAGILAVGITLVLGAAGTVMSWRLTAERSGFSVAAGYVRAHHSQPITSTEIMVFYFAGAGRTCLAPALPLEPAALGAYARAGFNYAVVERHNGSATVTYLTHHARLATSIPTLGDLDIGESPISSENSAPPGGSARGEYVRIYDISGLSRLGKGSRIIPCNRDRVT
ncbi:MAG TPA: glycosyltransferase family 39 protein [Chloroflexota bacterium]|nr:glycosyltransferase family 39 protein [Chloroflexota bacterium]